MNNVLPKYFTNPLSGKIRPISIFNKVFFPTPFLPMIAVYSPLFKSKETSLRTFNFP